MEPITVMLLSQAGGALLGLLGNALAEGDEEKARQIRKDIAKQFGDQAVPHFEQKAAEQAQQLAPEDPSLRRRQMDVLAGLQREYEMGGMTEADKAALDIARQQTSAKTASDVGTIQQQLASRGAGSGIGGAYLSMQAAQGGTNALADIDRQAQADARRRALAALEGSGSLAGQMRGQDLGYGTAQSAIDRFNTGMRFDAQREASNRVQQEYENQVGKSQRVAGAQNQVAQGYQQSAAGTRGAFGAAGGAVQEAGQTYYGHEQGKKKRDDE